MRLVAKESLMKDKLNHIDSIRGIAILMVILVHTAQTVNSESGFLNFFAAYGQMGVQLFFIASAYTLCYSWLKRTDEAKKVSNFGIRRFFRIAPLYYFGLAMYFIVSAAENYYRSGVVEPAEQYSLVNIVINLLFLNGFYPPANNNIVPGGWSIGTEMCFYALFPLIMFLLGRKTRSMGAASIKYSVLGLVASQAILLALWFFTGKTIQNNNFIYFNIVTQLPVFLTGISFYFLNNHGVWPVRSALTNLLYFLFFTFLAMLLWKYPSGYQFSLIPFISGISFVFLVKIFEIMPSVNLVGLQEIGKMSYSMYIFHFLFAHKAAVLVNHQFLLEDILGGNTTLIVYYIFTVILSFLLAKITERMIEHRFIRIGGNIIKHRITKSSTGLAVARR